MKTYTISEVSKRMGIPSSTLRYYEDEGLLSEVERTPSGQRIYTDKHIGRLEVIGCFKGAGMTLDELRDFLSYEEHVEDSIEDMLSLLERRRHTLHDQILTQIEAYENLLRKLAYYNDVKKSLDNGQTQPCWEDYAKKEYHADFNCVSS